MAIKERPTVVHFRLGGDVGGDGARPTCRAGAGEVSNSHALVAVHETPALCNLMVKGEAPEAATGESLKEVHLTSTQMGVLRDELSCRLDGDVGGAVTMQRREGDAAVDAL